MGLSTGLETSVNSPIEKSVRTASGIEYSLHMVSIFVMMKGVSSLAGCILRTMLSGAPSQHGPAFPCGFQGRRLPRVQESIPGAGDKAERTVFLSPRLCVRPLSLDVGIPGMALALARHETTKVSRRYPLPAVKTSDFHALSPSMILLTMNVNARRYGVKLVI